MAVKTITTKRVLVTGKYGFLLSEIQEQDFAVSKHQYSQTIWGKENFRKEMSTYFNLKIIP